MRENKKSQSVNKIQDGGAGKKIIPKFKEPKYSPYVGIKEKEMRKQRYEEQKFLKPRVKEVQPPLVQPPPAPGQNPLVDLQVYEPMPKKKRAPEPTLYMPYTTTTPYFPPQYFGMPFQQGFLQTSRVPYVKEYNINIDGPTADATRVNTIYEDLLPRDHFQGTANTVGERVDLYKFIRASLLKSGDGEEVDLDGAGENSLLKYIKFIHLNPYNTNLQTVNPYKGLPKGLLIYSTCYPIRYAAAGNYVRCAKDSTGVLVKIYDMQDIEYRVWKDHISKKEADTKLNDFDLWREINYYEFIREEIVKSKKCPNFTIFYGYYICPNCKIDFTAVNRIAGYYEKIRESMTQVKEPPPIHYYYKKDKVEEVRSLALVALTEAPTHNLLQWGTQTYTAHGGVNRMVNTGFHKSEVWRSILFQLMIALYAMQMNKIAFGKFDVFENVFIRDTKTSGNSAKHWKYKIDGVDYYVPNYGYVVLVDSSYRDVPDDYTIGTGGPKKRKVYASIFKDAGITDQFINDLCFDAFKNSFNSNNYKNRVTNSGFVSPPEDIMSLLNEIHNEAVSPTPEKKIGHYVHKYMRFYLNNRVGTYLKDSEVDNIRKDDSSKFYDGQIVVQEVGYDTYKFVVFKKLDGTTATILTKEDGGDGGIVEKQVRADS
ncbi:MAG: hypothetical protein GTN36_01380, partial [Candidatus Aenigmarchaeota archaeon]|nr:hypothetical protein [Candidatus Aenigmarchaeota archaeon]